MPRRQTAVFLGIAALGALLRLWTIGDGLPYIVGSDEPVVMGNVTHMLKTGDLHPSLVDYGGLIFYFHLVVAGLRFAVGYVTGVWSSVADVAANDFYLWGRIATALVDVATIYVVYRAALRWSASVALLAAFAMAIQPQLVQSAHFALTDTPLTFFVALTLLCSLRAAESGTYRAFLIAGAAAGLGTGLKFYGAVAGIMPLCALAAIPAARWLGSAAMIFAGALVAFVIVSPYTVLDFPWFLHGFTTLASGYMGDYSLVGKADLYRKHVMSWFGLPGVLSRSYAWPATIVMLIGVGAIGAGLRARDTRARTAILLVFPLLYFAMLANTSFSFGRYAMPLIPAISIALAAGMVSLYDLVAKQAPSAHAIARASLLLLFILPLLSSVSFNQKREPIDTLEMTGAWLDQNVRPTEPIVLESRAVMFQLPERRFRARHVIRLIDEALDTYRTDGTVYLVAVGWNWADYFKNPAQFPEQIAAYNAIFQGTELVQTITPSNPLDPEVRILRVK
jgi:hypothetical protein